MRRLVSLSSIKKSEASKHCKIYLKFVFRFYLSSDDILNKTIDEIVNESLKIRKLFNQRLVERICVNVCHFKIEMSFVLS